MTGQLLLHDRVDVMTVVPQISCEIVGKILIDFESHAGNEWISSRANSAPYAAAARIPSIVSVGY